MSEENVELVRKGHDFINAFMRGEMSSEAAMEIIDPQAEFRWHDQRTFPDEPQHLRSYAEVIRWLENFREAMDEFVVEPREFIEAPGDRVLVSVRQSSRGRESGVPLATHFLSLCTVRDGKVRKVELFRHRADALEAAGLRE
jgi:ketosteroid isomerase-like protein